MQEYGHLGGVMENNNGFTLLEVTIAMVVVAAGLLTMQMLQVRSVDENATSGWITEKSMHAAANIERIMNLPYGSLVDTDGDGTGQDLDFNGIDDQDDGNVNTVLLNEQFGLRHSECCPGNFDPRGNIVVGCTQVADQCAVIDEYDIYWNIAEDVPVENTKTVNIIIINQYDRQTRLANRPEMLNRAEYRYIKDDII